MAPIALGIGALALASQSALGGTTSRPPQLVELEPAEGAKLAGLELVRVVLAASRGAEIDPASLAITHDRSAPSRDCEIRSTRDVPPSRLEIGCRFVGIAPGPHQFTLSFTLGTGERAVYSWNVEVEPP